MSAASSTALLTAGIAEVWGYITPNFPLLLAFGIGLSIIGLIFYRLVKGVRHAF